MLLWATRHPTPTEIYLNFMEYIVSHTEMHHRLHGLLFAYSRKWYPMFCRCKPSSWVIKLVYVSAGWVLFYASRQRAEIIQTDHSCKVFQQPNNLPIFDVFLLKTPKKTHLLVKNTRMIPTFYSDVSILYLYLLGGIPASAIWFGLNIMIVGAYVLCGLIKKNNSTCTEYLSAC